MADMMQTGIAWLAEKLKSHASKTVTYHRKHASVEVQATIGRTELETDDGLGGIKVEFTDRDFLITAADLVLNGKVIEPESGDRIKETVGSNIHTYEVMAPGGAEQPWRWSDPHRIIMRIHTKEVRVQ